MSSLLLRLGKQVHIVTSEARPSFVEDLTKRGAAISFTDARDVTSLLNAGLLEAEALIACTSSDLTNIEIALDARSVAPNLRIVARIFDQTLGEQLKESMGIDLCLAMSTIAAPRFAAEALKEHVIGHFDLAGQNYAVHLGSDGDLDIGNGRFVSVQKQATALDRHRVRRAGQLSTLLAQIPRSLLHLMLAILALTVLSTAIFCSAMGLSVMDALYFVVTTLTTTGYGDITPKEHSTWIKVYTCILMILGSASVAVLYSIITDIMLSARLAEAASHQRVIMKDHVIVVGLGNVGYRTVQSLVLQGKEVVVIDLEKASNLSSILPRSVPYLCGDGRNPNHLELASIKTARAIIATTQDDSVNLAVGFSAKKIAPECRVVVRLFDGNFARKVETSTVIERAMSASFLSAPGFVAGALFSDAVFGFTVDSELVVIQHDSGGFRVEKVQLLD